MSEPRGFPGKGGQRFDPDLFPSVNALRLRWWLERAAQHWSDGLPGGEGRRWRRLCQRFLAFGDPRAEAALAGYTKGALGDFGDLRLIAQLVAQTGDMARYEALLHAYDPALVLSDAPQKAFFGQGGGLGALNVFRKLEAGGEVRFEKIYAQSRPELARNTFALETVLARFPVIDTPVLRARHDGQRLTVLEYDFVPFSPMTCEAPEDVAPVVRRLAEIDVAPFKAMHKRFRRPYSFGGWQRQIERRLRARDPALAAAHATNHGRWLAQVERHPLVFSHGDLNFDNISSAGTVLDWDNAGFRHYGFDAAYTCRRSRFEDADALLAFCGEHYERPQSAARDRFAFAFFFLWMMPAKKVHWNNLPLFDTLLARLPALAQAAED